MSTNRPLTQRETMQLVSNVLKFSNDIGLTKKLGELLSPMFQAAWDYATGKTKHFSTNLPANNPFLPHHNLSGAWYDTYHNRLHAFDQYANGVIRMVTDIGDVRYTFLGTLWDGEDHPTLTLGVDEGGGVHSYFIAHLEDSSRLVGKAITMNPYQEGPLTLVKK